MTEHKEPKTKCRRVTKALISTPVEALEPPVITQKLTYFMKSCGGLTDSAYHTTVVLSIPSEDEECPITMEKMAEYKLEFLGASQSFYKNHKKHTKATLDCSHSFNAMALLYHFVKNGMTCPCCREGHKDRLDDLSIPEHIRKPILEHYKKERQQEEIEQDIESVHAIIEMLQSEVGGGNIRAFLERNTVELFIYSYESMDSFMPISTSQQTLSASEQGTDMCFSTLGYNMRTFALNRRLFPVVSNVFEFVVATRNVYNGPLMLHRSTKFHMDSLRTSQNIPSYQEIPGVSWTASFLRGENKLEFEKITWRTPMTTFVQRVLEEAAAMDLP